MPGSVRFFIFATLIATAGTRAAAQSHGNDKPPVKHGAQPPTAPAPAPESTARAVAAAAVESRSRRQPARVARRAAAATVVPPVPRFEVSWPGSRGRERVRVLWPEAFEPRRELAWPVNLDEAVAVSSPATP